LPEAVASAERVLPIADQAAVMFYERLFEVAPQVKAMFPADMAEQRQEADGDTGRRGQRPFES